MTLGEFRNATQDMSDDSVTTDENNKEVIIFIGEEE